jgi:hypothetical protein
VNDELEMTWKERPWFNFKLLSRHLPGATEETTRILTQDSRSPDQDLNPEPTEYEVGVLATRRDFRCFANNKYYEL